MPRKLFILSLLTVLGQCAAAFAADNPDQFRVMLSPSLHPAAETAFVPSPDELPAVTIDPAWYVKAGARKGLSGQADTRTELLVAPDIAVLSRGLSALWPALLAGFQETTALVVPQDVAELNASKQLLVIPSGALAGTNQSRFFKAGLAEYVRNGGTLFCLSQRRGLDFSVLPVPGGEHLEAVGWSEDSGPLFRASIVRDDHPLLKDLAQPAPLIETDGYIRTYPSSALVLLVRPDGFPTLLVYSYGKGQVLVGTVFTDLSSLLGSPERDEKTLLRNLLSWTKSERRDTRPAGKKTENGRKKRAPAVLTPGTPLPPVRGAVTLSDGRLRIEIELPGSAQLKGQQVVVRTEGQEKTVTLSQLATTIAFEALPPGNERRISYAVYGKQGRSLARGSLALPAAADSAALPARPFYLPGDLAAFGFNGIGKGQVTLEALGYMNDQIIPDRGTIRMEVPDDLPAGTYRVLWLFENIGGVKKRSSFPLDVAGYRVAIEDATVSTSRDAKGMLNGRVVFTIRSGKKISGQMHLMLRLPDGRTVAAAEPVVSLVEGVQSMPVSFPLGQDLSGTWELSYRFSAALPVGPALPPDPLDLDAGSLLFDRGEDGVLAVSTRPLLQYEPGPATVSAVLIGKGSTTVQVSVDGKEFSSEVKELSGAAEYAVSLPKLGVGTHALRVSLSGQGPAASREYRFISGLRLPDLTVNLQAGEPRAGENGPVLPLTIAFANEGKSASGPVRLALSEGDPARGGRPIASIDVPALAPGEKAARPYDWPLYRNAGTRTLWASVDDEARIEEADRNNNRASLSITVPDLLLLARTPKKDFSSADPISLSLDLFNLGTKPLQGVSLSSSFSGPAGKTISAHTLPVPEIKPGNSVSLEQMFTPATPLPATYTLSATASGAAERASASVRFRVLPTLLFSGTLDNTPATALPCRPFTFKAGIRSTGNVLHTSGTVGLQVFGTDQAKPLLVRTYPLAVGERSIKIDSLDLPVGAFTLRLTASAANDQFNLSREFTLAERGLTVAGPVQAKRVESTFPRILILRGHDGRLVEQAVAETMLQQAFDQEDVFAKTVGSGDEFMAQAATGMFNVYMLFEPEEKVKTAWLKEKIQQGQGAVVIGTGAAARAVAEDLGFTFRDLPAKTNNAITFSDRSPLVVSGTIPVSGKGLQVRKSGAQTAAFYGSPDQPAMLIDGTKKGKVIVLPLSVSRSAYEGGTTALYSLVLRKAGLFAVPEGDGGGALSGGISVSAQGGAVESRVVETLPAGSKVVWSNLQSTVSGARITYDLKAEREPRRLLYLYQPGAAGDQHGRSEEVFYQCNGTYLSQGRIE